MARKKSNDLMQVAGIAAAVSLVIVLIFYGGTISGNSTQNFNTTVVVTGVTSCSIQNATAADNGDSGSILDFGTLEAASTSGTAFVLLENDGTNIVNVSIDDDGNMATSYGGAATTVEAKVDDLTSDGTTAISTYTAIAGQDYETLLSPIDNNDDANFQLLINATSDSSLLAGTYTIDDGVVFTCTGDTDGA